MRCASGVWRQSPDSVLEASLPPVCFLPKNRSAPPEESTHAVIGHRVALKGRKCRYKASHRFLGGGWDG